MKIIKLLNVIFVVVIFMACTKKSDKSVTKEKYGEMPDGRIVNAYTIKNSKGVEIKIIEYGGRIVSLKVPDKNGNIDDIVLGYNSLEEYLKDANFFGAIIGRYANRIDNGKFTLDGQEYQLARNEGQNHLHGGQKGFYAVLWKGQRVNNSEGKGVQLEYVSEDGEQGYPGRLNVKVTYLLTNDNELVIKYRATTNRPTILNLTNHAYFNLNGDGNQSVLNHDIRIKANKFTPTDKQLIPTGEIKSVENTPMDFREFKKIGKDINADYTPLEYGGGYDHNWVLNRENEDRGKVATLKSDRTGRIMEIYTDMPGLQFYSGNQLDGSVVGKSGQPYTRYSGLCLETQYFPDSPNHENFSSCLLKPGEKFSSQTIYKFLVE